MLLFGAETWVLAQKMEWALDIFKSRVNMSNTGKHPRRREDGSWDYLPLAEVLGEVGLEGIRTSVTRRQNTIEKYIVTRQILDLCERATRRPVARVSRRWWGQDGIDLEGVKKRVTETTTVSESESEEEADVELNEYSSGEKESQGASGLSGAEWSGANE